MKETRQISNLNSRAFNVFEHQSGQFSRTFLRDFTNILNERPENIETQVLTISNQKLINICLKYSF